MMVSYSARAVSTAIRGTDEVSDETNGRMTLQVTLELRRLAPSHSPERIARREKWVRMK